MMRKIILKSLVLSLCSIPTFLIPYPVHAASTNVTAVCNTTEETQTRSDLERFLVGELHKSLKHESGWWKAATVRNFQIIGYERKNNDEYVLAACNVNDKEEIVQAIVSTDLITGRKHSSIGFCAQVPEQTKYPIAGVHFRGSVNGSKPTFFTGFVNDNTIKSVRISVSNQSVEVPVLQQKVFMGLIDSSTIKKSIRIEGLNNKGKIVYKIGS